MAEFSKSVGMRGNDTGESVHHPPLTPAGTQAVALVASHQRQVRLREGRCSGAGRTGLVGAALLLGAFFTQPGCGAAEESPTPDVSATPEGPTPTPTVTPEPLQLTDGNYTFYSVYALSVKPKGSETTYVLKPYGTGDIASDTLSGTIRWRIFANSTDYGQCNEVCIYEETVTGQYDGSIYHSEGCVNCQTYYAVQFAPPASNDCTAEALNALLDSNDDGTIASTELNHVDQWGFSPLSDGQYPPAWTEFSSWEGLKASLETYDVPYAAWSRQWHTASAAYLPLYALYPVSVPEPCADAARLER